MNSPVSLPIDLQPKVRPFLKWAGGKYRLVDRVKEALWSAAQARKRLIEPFAGSGAVFLNTSYDKYLIGDSNGDVINVFEKVKNGGRSFIDYVRLLFTPENNQADAYYRLRSEFNTTADSERKAALFIYLNRHCFNGLCRYNSKGAFNVPFGKYVRPPFPELEMETFADRSARAEFTKSDFLATMDRAESGDVVYCDPPYVPLSPTSNFTDYTLDGFGPPEQAALTQKAAELAKNGIPVVISNHDTQETGDAYRSAGAAVTSFEVQRFISCDASNRGKAKELLAVFA